MRDLELLAPARTADIGIAAIDCGADAVYIAGPEFGARQAAGNPIGDIRRLCDYAHAFGSRIFATLNTIIYDGELEAACRMMAELQEAGADAIIIQDMALSPAGLQLSGAVPGLRIPLHASTQCAIRTPRKAALLEKLGFSRLILERELSLEQIRKIRDAVSCELEFFVHGALCVCYSGQCYISESIAGRSANRGSCIQACRALYDLEDENGKKLLTGKPLLSLKDLNLKDRLEALADAGVSSFKIEGRLKSISYVKNIVRDYSIALDNLVAKYPDKYRRASYGKTAGGFTPMPEKTFNRGYTSLFIDGSRGQWASEDAATSLGEIIGRAELLSRDASRFRIRPAKAGLKLNNGDGLCFVTSGNDVTGFRADVCDGLTVKCKPVPGLKDGAVLYRNIDTAFEKALDTDMPHRRIAVSLQVSVAEDGRQLFIDAVTEDGRHCTVSSPENLETAKNPENMERTIIAQLSKTSGRYSFSVLPFRSDALPFLPVAAVNSLRREVAEKIDAMPCMSRPLHKGRIAQEILTSRPIDGQEITYRENLANCRAEALASALGAASTEDAYELSHKPGAELMRTKYCIRYQYGRCPARHRQHWPSKLFLENNGRRFPLGFDCSRCEMSVMDSE